jgi:hypothetical protein
MLVSIFLLFVGWYPNMVYTLAENLSLYPLHWWICGVIDMHYN